MGSTGRNVSDVDELVAIAKRGIGLLVVAAGAMILAFVVGIPIFVYPPQDPTEDVDMVLVLGPPTVDRFDRAVEISSQNGHVPIVLSVGVEWAPGRERELQTCRQARVECFVPDPFTTKGEAKLLRTLMADRQGADVAIITSAPHLVRSRYIFERCFGESVSLVSVPFEGTLTDLLHQYAYQTAAMVKAVMSTCD